MAPPDKNRTRPDFTPTIPFETGPSEPAPPAPSLKPGHMLAGRFRIVRFIAQGGMGEVWEAEDLELPGERVALKTIRPTIARDGWATGRFRREIQLGRKITHPNVCRIFDVFHHRPGTLGTAASGGPDGEITFLTMELLVGETLQDRLERVGRLTTAESLPIVRHMAAALQAAHEAEIIHGDFKSSNVILVGEGEGMRAVVTDFGLSRGGGAAAGLLTSVPAGDNLVGTPAYMAPEQVRGGRSSVAADIYSLGIVVFEMLTGRLPFQAETAISSAVMRLSEPPPPPRSLVPDLDLRWEFAVLRCLALDPADRFARATDLARALEPDAPLPPVRRPLWLRPWFLGSAAAALLLTVALWRGPFGRLPPPAESGPVPPALAAAPARRTIAVLGFKNVSARPEAAWLSTALSEMLATELAAGNQMRVIPSENVARMRVELGLSEFSTLAGDTLARVRGILGSDLVVVGSYTVLGAEKDAPIRLDLSLQDAATGQTEQLDPQMKPASELFTLVSNCGIDLRKALGTAELQPDETRGTLAAFSTQPEAARLYAEGLALLRRFEVEAARVALERAVAADPQQPLAHAALASAWSAAGYDERAIAAAKQAFELARALPLEQRLEVEGRYREIASEWPKAIDVYRTLYGNYPDNLDYGLRLAEMLVAGGQGVEARAILQQLRGLAAPAGSDPRIDLFEARVAESLSEF
jgi:eukaryotic-like serine/threonine-protein kinase